MNISYRNNFAKGATHSTLTEMNLIATILFALYCSSAHVLSDNSRREYSDWISYREDPLPTRTPATRLPETKPLPNASAHKFDENRSRAALDYVINRLLSALPEQTPPQNIDSLSRVPAAISAPEVDKSIHFNLIFINDNLVDSNNLRGESRISNS